MAFRALGRKRSSIAKTRAARAAEATQSRGCADEDTRGVRRRGDDAVGAGERVLAYVAATDDRAIGPDRDRISDYPRDTPLISNRRCAGVGVDAEDAVAGDE